MLAQSLRLAAPLWPQPHGGYSATVADARRTAALEPLPRMLRLCPRPEYLEESLSAQESVGIVARPDPNVADEIFGTMTSAASKSPEPSAARNRGVTASLSSRGGRRLLDNRAHQ
jgi:hypothetical protein